MHGDLIDADKAGVKVDDRGFIAVDNQMRTNIGHIFAIGDIRNTAFKQGGRNILLLYNI